jgi:protein SCO1/2
MKRRSSFARVLAATLVLAPSAAGCRRAAPPAAGARHPVEGKAVSVDAARRSITIAHKDIPGFMPAMTMEFVVLERDAALLARVSPGDELTASLVVADTRYWLEDLVVVKKGTPDPDAKPGRERREAQPGDALPDVSLVDQDGRSFRLSELRGKAYALSFVFTRCPLPDFCPLMMRHFASAEAQLIADAALRERTRLISVSFDTKYDTPPVLRRFGGPFQKTTPHFTHWRLATGKEQAIRALGAALELDYVEESASFTHNLRTAVIDPAGKLFRLFRGNDWQPEELVSSLRAALAEAASPARPAPAGPEAR